MEKLTLIIMIFIGWSLLCEKAYSTTAPESYIVVGVSGFGTRRPENAWQPSGAHENLPLVSSVEKTYRLVHFAKKSELDEVMDEFSCSKGKQARDGLGLVLVINSWGAGVAHKLAVRYHKECGRLVDHVVLVDGVAKPVGPFRKSFPTLSCLNFYQTKGVIRGRAIDGCKNQNLTPLCEQQGRGAIDCHIYVEWEGTARARAILENTL